MRKLLLEHETTAIIVCFLAAAVAVWVGAAMSGPAGWIRFALFAAGLGSIWAALWVIGWARMPMQAMRRFVRKFRAERAATPPAHVDPLTWQSYARPEDGIRVAQVSVGAVLIKALEQPHPPVGRWVIAFDTSRAPQRRIPIYEKPYCDHPPARIEFLNARMEPIKSIPAQKGWGSAWTATGFIHVVQFLPGAVEINDGLSSDETVRVAFYFDADVMREAQLMEEAG